MKMGWYEYLAKTKARRGRGASIEMQSNFEVLTGLIADAVGDPSPYVAQSTTFGRTTEWVDLSGVDPADERFSEVLSAVRRLHNNEAIDEGYLADLKDDLIDEALFSERCEDVMFWPLYLVGKVGLPRIEARRLIRIALGEGVLTPRFREGECFDFILTEGLTLQDFRKVVEG